MTTLTAIGGHPDSDGPEVEEVEETAERLLVLEVDTSPLAELLDDELPPDVDDVELAADTADVEEVEVELVDEVEDPPLDEEDELSIIEDVSGHTNTASMLLVGGSMKPGSALICLFDCGSCGGPVGSEQVYSYPHPWSIIPSRPSRFRAPNRSILTPVFKGSKSQPVVFRASCNVSSSRTPERSLYGGLATILIVILGRHSNRLVVPSIGSMHGRGMPTH